MKWVAPDFKLKKGILCLTFDDFRPTDYSRAYPLMVARGIKGTSYTTGSDKSWENAREMWRNGWDIECHSDTHSDMTKLTTQQIEQEMVNMNQKFMSAKIPKPKHFGYPYGFYNPTTQDAIKQHRLTQRRYRPELTEYNTYDINELELRGLQADISTVTQLNQIKELINQAESQKLILITVMHSLVDVVTGGDQCKIEYFTQLLDYALTKDIYISTISQMYNLVKYHKTIS